MQTLKCSRAFTNKIRLCHKPFSKWQHSFHLKIKMDPWKAKCLYNTHMTPPPCKKRQSHSVWTNYFQFHNVVITGDNLSCHNNLWCCQWWLSCQIDDLLFSVFFCFAVVCYHTLGTSHFHPYPLGSFQCQWSHPEEHEQKKSTKTNKIFTTKTKQHKTFVWCVHNLWDVLHPIISFKSSICVRTGIKGRDK